MPLVRLHGALILQKSCVRERKWCLRVFMLEWWHLVCGKFALFENRVGFLLWFLFVSSFLIYFRLYLTSHSLTCDFFCQHLKSQGLMVLFFCNVYLQSFITSCLSDISAYLNNWRCSLFILLPGCHVHSTLAFFSLFPLHNLLVFLCLPGLCPWECCRNQFRFLFSIFASWRTTLISYFPIYKYPYLCIYIYSHT